MSRETSRLVALVSRYVSSRELSVSLHPYCCPNNRRMRAVGLIWVAIATAQKRHILASVTDMHTILGLLANMAALNM